jgi:hypothetical protein
LGEVRVPASREIILYANGSRGGLFDLSALAASSVRAHLDMDRRRACGIVGVDELELVVSERSGESSAESGAGIVSRRGRSISIRWGSSETDRLSGCGGRLIEGAPEGGNNQCCYLSRGRSGTSNVHGRPSLILAVLGVASPAFLFFNPKSLRVSHLADYSGRRFS